MTDRQSETNHLLVQIRDLLGDIALSIAESGGTEFSYGRPFRYSDTFRRMQAEQSRLEKEHDVAEQRRREEEQFRELIEAAKEYILEKSSYGYGHEEEYCTNLLNKYPDHPEKWRSNDGELLWEGMGITRTRGGLLMNSGGSLRKALRKRGRL